MLTYLVHGMVTALGSTGIKSPGLSSIVKDIWVKFSFDCITQTEPWRSFMNYHQSTVVRTNVHTPHTEPVWFPVISSPGDGLTLLFTKGWPFVGVCLVLSFVLIVENKCRNSIWSVIDCFLFSEQFQQFTFRESWVSCNLTWYYVLINTRNFPVNCLAAWIIGCFKCTQLTSTSHWHRLGEREWSVSG